MSYETVITGERLKNHELKKENEMLENEILHWTDTGDDSRLFDFGKTLKNHKSQKVIDSIKHRDNNE